jgi:hypothetical protein
MKKIFVVILMVLAGYKQLSAQTGFFLIVDNKNSCSKPLYSLDGRQRYCVTDEAIIKDSEFKVEGNIQDDLTQRNQYFTIRFTKNGLETLKLICENFPEQKLLFVVNGKVAGTYDNKKLIPMALMPISGLANSKEIKWVYDNLTKPH